MVERVELVLDGLEDAGRVGDAAVVAEQADELGLEEVFVAEAVLDDEGDDLAELLHGSAELEEDGCRVLVDMGRNVDSLGQRVVDRRRWRWLLRDMGGTSVGEGDGGREQGAHLSLSTFLKCSGEARYEEKLV